MKTIRCYLTVRKCTTSVLNYLRWNPVTAGFVAEPWHWIYSRATDYFTEKKGLLDIVIFKWFLVMRISNKVDTGRSTAPVD